MDGWIKLHRKTLENPVVCKDSDYIAVWMYLLLNATHKEHQTLFAGEKITLQPGQLITGRKTISEKFNIDESKVQRILKSFENEQQIEQQTSNKNRLISIVSWPDYQDCEQQDEHQVNNNCTTTEQQVNTNKNVKNLKNERIKELKDIKTFAVYTSNTDLNYALESFVEFRKKIKKPMTDRAIDLLLSKLDKLATNDEEKIAILEQSILNGWQSVFPVKNKDGGKIANARERVENHNAGIDFGF
ncbi:hypothetical protein [Paenibacillus sp. UMB4589-SE434]|uniref:hypothetical protein n=1 Tax=Paenibacillus sp. UMB4589-SE434 TaxID=3046314 RepID=UPI00254C025B|nr:hypothetical protein [Paenibacillus sp. UMB4589-SE434]MDK8182079.1 hypothetical protein [Paenibacillus sp. UMB4589-SE434]